MMVLVTITIWLSSRESGETPRTIHNINGIWRYNAERGKYLKVEATVPATEAVERQTHKRRRRSPRKAGK